jgi:hypothetical protein
VSRQQLRSLGNGSHGLGRDKNGNQRRIGVRNGKVNRLSATSRGGRKLSVKSFRWRGRHGRWVIGFCYFDPAQGEYQMCCWPAEDCSAEATDEAEPCQSLDPDDGDQGPPDQGGNAGGTQGGGCCGKAGGCCCGGCTCGCGMGNDNE